MAVAALVGEAGGGEDDMIAALLHDVVEDQGVTIEEIRTCFGADVAAIVAGCSDGTPGQARDATDWEGRKRAYLTHLEEAPPRVLLVSCADKLHNARSIVADLRQHGAALWDRFNAKRDQQLWYFDSLVAAFRRAPGAPAGLLDELERTVSTMRQLA
jgi:(p)ppGpp synthase/HD superfamily hydrolase